MNGLIDQLKARLIIGPPSVRYLISLISDSETVKAFFDLVDEYLPEEREWMRSHNLKENINHFTYKFSEKYFPINDNYYGFVEEPEELGTLVRWIPVSFEGFTEDDYESIDENSNPGQLLAAAVVECPFGEGGARISVLENLAKIIGEAPLKKIPGNGWTMEELKNCIKEGSPYIGLLAFCMYIHEATGNAYLDTDYENYSGEVEWSRHNVNLFTEEYKGYLKLMDQMKKFNIYISASPKSRIIEVINWLDKHVRPRHQEGKLLKDTIASDRELALANRREILARGER